MPSTKKKNKSNKAPTISTNEPAVELEAEWLAKVHRQGTLPVASYIAVVGVHTTLLAFTALFLPRTPLSQHLAWFDGDTTQTSSRDRPQHPFLEALTLSPTSTLLSLCTGAVILQGWWSEWVKDWWRDSMIQGTGDEQKLERVAFDKQKITDFLNASGMTLLVSLVLHVVLILFGAPIASHILQTYLFALLVSVLIVFPPAYLYGPPKFGNDSNSVVRRWTWVRLFAELAFHNPIERALVYPIIGTTVGSWLGVIPLALDWDRPWQAWPLSPAYSAIVGYIVASIAALTVNAFLLGTQQRPKVQTADNSKTK